MAKELNLIGVKCPMNLVKIKLLMEEMKNGEIITVIIDDPVALEDIPMSIEDEGHEILNKEELEKDKIFKLAIKKIII